MKTNVDLTLNNKFSSNRLSRERSGILNVFSLMLKDDDLKYPWTRNVKRIRSFESVNLNGVLTGNKIERKNKKQEKACEENETCECCGRQFDKRPWMRGKYFICKICNSNLDIDDMKYWHKSFSSKRIRAAKQIITLNEVIERLE